MPGTTTRRDQTSSSRPPSPSSSDMQHQPFGEMSLQDMMHGMQPYQNPLSPDAALQAILFAVTQQHQQQLQPRRQAAPPPAIDGTGTRHLEDRIRELEGRVEKFEKTARKKTTRSDDDADPFKWYSKTHNPTHGPQAQKAWIQLNDMVRSEWRRLIGVETARAALPGPTERFTSAGQPAFPSDFTESATLKSAGNLAVVKRLTRVVMAQLKKPSSADSEEDNEGDQPDADEGAENDPVVNETCKLSVFSVNVLVIEDAIRQQLKNFRRQYKQQTDEAAQKKKAAADHYGRVESSKRAKLKRRLDGCDTFEMLHGRNPEPVVLLDMQSGDESAGEDGILQAQYEVLLKIDRATKNANKGVKIVAKQKLAYRAEWVTKLYNELDDIYHEKTSTAQTGKRNLRVPDGNGRVVVDPPDRLLRKHAPPPCMVDPRWRKRYDDVDLGDYGWNDSNDPDDWGPYEDEAEKFAGWR